MAVAGVAMRALQNFTKNNKTPFGMGNTADENVQERKFGLTLVRAMVQAIKADGNFTDEERGLIAKQIQESNLDEVEGAALLAELDKPVDIDALVQDAKTDLQKAELYLASRLAADPEKRSDNDYLSLLKSRLNLPDGLLQQVDMALFGKPH